MGKKAYVVFGYSFGGKVVILCENEWMVLLSSVGILELKFLKVCCKIFLVKIFKKLGLNLGFLRSKDVMGFN